MNRMQHNHHRQAGAVSLFVVIFAALLTVVITVSFIRMVVQEQQRATNNDLSQSAYDSAMAGVEDAKRAIIRYNSICNSGGDCQQARADLTSDTCNYGITGDSSGSEVLIQRDETDTGSLALDQAYTCVKISLETPSYEIENLTPGTSAFVPLSGTDSFDRITVSWFEKENSADPLLDLEQASDGMFLRSSWPANRPSVLRSQLVQVADEFTLTDFDNAEATVSNTDTLFFYPVRVGMSTAPFTPYGFNFRDGAQKTPKAVRCQLDISAGGYACTARIVLPDAVGAADSSERNAFLRVGAYYNTTNVQIALYDGSYDEANLVYFDAVQPRVDSTGRANDLFRRVEALLDVGKTTFPYPEAALGLSGSLCKNFSVTEDQYFSGESCEP